MSAKRLQGLRVAVLAVDGFEQVEVTIPMRALRPKGPTFASFRCDRDGSGA